ncbi:unnamed protein product [Brassica oleracea var. botrytis]
MLPLRVGSEYRLLIHFCFLRKPQDFHLPSTSDEECQMIKNEPWEQESQVKVLAETEITPSTFNTISNSSDGNQVLSIDIKVVMILGFLIQRKRYYGFLIFVNTVASLNHRDSWDLESSDYRPCDVLTSRLGDTFIQALTTSLPFLPLFLIGLIIHQMTICSSFCSLVILVLINLLASKVFFSFLYMTIPTWIATSAPLVLTSKSTLSNKMEKLSNSRFGPQQVKSVSERSPAFTTEELIRDYGVGKSWLLLRFALQTAPDRHPFTFVLKRNDHSHSGPHID